MAKRVLVVAGREGIAPAFQVQIELWGDSLEFALAASGNEALWEIRGSPYECVLAPWQIPEMTGIEFAEVVQALSPATKVVLVGAPITPPLQSQAERLHVFALLPEVSPQEVAAVLSRALGMPLPRPKPPAPPPPRKEPPPPVQEKPAPPPRREGPPPPPVQEKPAPPPRREGPPPPPAPKVTLTPAQEESIRRALRELVASVGPQVAFLSSAAGDPLVVEGNGGDLPLPALAARMAAALAASGDLVRLLADEHSLCLSLFSGARYDVYAFTITEATALLLVLDKRIVESKLGSIWLYTRRIVEDLRNALG